MTLLKIKALINVAIKSKEMTCLAEVCALRVYLYADVVLGVFKIALYVISVPLMVVIVAAIESESYHFATE